MKTFILSLSLLSSVFAFASSDCESLKSFDGEFSVAGSSIKLSVDGCELNGMNENGPDIYDGKKRYDADGDSTVNTILDDNSGVTTIQQVVCNKSGKGYNYNSDGTKYVYYKNIVTMSTDIEGVLTFSMKAYDRQDELLDEMIMNGEKNK